MGKRLAPWCSVNGVGILFMVLVLILWVTFAAATRTEAREDRLLHHRQLVAVEGYGARCAVLFNNTGAMAAEGSAAMHCSWTNKSYSGDWRRMQPRSD